MTRFEFRKDELVYTELIKLFPEFNNLYKHNSRKDPNEINKAFKYIFFMADISSDNPFASEKKSRKQSEILFRLFADRNYKFLWRLEEKISLALDLYIKINSASEEALLKVLEEKKVQIKQLIDDSEPEIVEFTDASGVIKYESNIALLTQVLQAIVDIDARRKTIISAIKNEAINNKVRGQVYLSPLATGALKIPTENKEINE